MEERQRTLSGPPESIHPGSAIAGKYVLESMLGSGAMGTVWIATHVNLGSKVAVKLVSPDFARSEEARSRFLAEAKAAAALRSRYVVQMFDSGVTDGAPYIVMEYLKGESLEERLQRAGRLPIEQVLRMVGQVAKGLERAHSKNIVHRDLKPANIFLASTEDGEEVAKILDFGIAKMDHDDHDYKATATGVIMGTPLYMSPEQARGLKSLDHTSDLYSLGMVTYTALVGDVPFHAESFGDLVYILCTQDIPRTQEVAPWLPPTLDAWFRQACHKDPTQRFKSADEMYQALALASQVTGSRLPNSALQDSTLAVSSMGNPSLRESNSGPLNDSDAGRVSTANATLSYASSNAAGASTPHAQDQSGPWQSGSGSHTAHMAPDAAGTQPSAVANMAVNSTGGVTGRFGEPLPKSKSSKAPLFVGAFVLLAAAGAAGLWWLGNASSTTASADAPGLESSPAATEATTSEATEPTTQAEDPSAPGDTTQGSDPAAAADSEAAPTTAAKSSKQAAAKTEDDGTDKTDKADDGQADAEDTKLEAASTPTKTKGHKKPWRPKSSKSTKTSPKEPKQPKATATDPKPTTPSKPRGIDLGF